MKGTKHTVAYPVPSQLGDVVPGERFLGPQPEAVLAEPRHPKQHTFPGQAKRTMRHCAKKQFLEQHPN